MNKITLPKISMERSVAIALVVGAVIMFATLAMRTEEKHDAVSRAISVADPLIEVCLRGDDSSRVLASTRSTDGKPLCEAAAQVKAVPVQSSAPAIDDQRIRELIRAELAKMPKPAPAQPTMEQLVSAAESVIEGNPEAFRGQPGAPATSEQIMTVLSLYVRDHPDQFQGPRGEAGAAGRRGLPGKDGAPGQSGDSFGGLDFQQRGEQCVAVITITGVAGTRESTRPVSGVLCGEPSSPITVTVPPTPSLAPPEPTETGG